MVGLVDKRLGHLVDMGIYDTIGGPMWLLQAWIYLYFLGLKPADELIVHPHCMAHRLLSNGVSSKTLSFCFAYLANLTIKYKSDRETFFMPFIDKSF